MFFALWPNAAERAGMAARQPALKKLCRGRVMRADNLHATLVFLGNVEIARLDAAREAAEAVQFSPFQLGWNLLRCWAHNHIVHAAAEHIPGQLALLVRQLEENLAQRGFSFERRVYQPHVTLLRNANCGQAGLPEFAPAIWVVQDFVLLQSVGGKQGVHYEVLARFPCRN